MREQVIKMLGQILVNNIGSKLTEELASGIVNNTNMAWQQYEEMLAQERDEDLKMAKRLNVKRENENKIELQKIREREAEERKKALPEEKKPIYRYRMETVLDIKPDEGKKK